MSYCSTGDLDFFLEAGLKIPLLIKLHTLTRIVWVRINLSGVSVAYNRTVCVRYTMHVCEDYINADKII